MIRNRSNTAKGKEDVLKATASQSKHYKPEYCILSAEAKQPGDFKRIKLQNDNKLAKSPHTECDNRKYFFGPYVVN